MRGGDGREASPPFSRSSPPAPLPAGKGLPPLKVEQQRNSDLETSHGTPSSKHPHMPRSVERFTNSAMDFAHHPHMPHIHMPHPHMPHGVHLPHGMHMPSLKEFNQPHLPRLAKMKDKDAAKATGLPTVGHFKRLKNMLRHRVIASEQAKLEAHAEVHAEGSGSAEHEPGRPATIKLTRRDMLKGILWAACCLFAVLLLVWNRPHHNRTDVHQTKLARYGVYITSPLYAVSTAEPLVLGGLSTGPLALGSAHEMLDLKMVLPCTSTRSACFDISAPSAHRRRAEDARRLAEETLRRELAGSGSSGSGGGGMTPIEEATVVWEFWRGEPGSVGALPFVNGSVKLLPYAEIEVLRTLVPSEFGIATSDDVFLRISSHSIPSSKPHGVLVEVAQLDAVGANRLPLAMSVSALLLALILSEVINRVSALLGVVLVLGLNTWVYHAAEVHLVMTHVDWGTIVLLFSMMINVHLLSLTGFFEWSAVRVAAVARGNATVVFWLLSMLAGVLSAFLDNVTCVMLLGPVTISLCKQMQVPSVPFYLTETLAATIGGTATLVGDPPNVVISQRLGVGFVDFLVHNGLLVLVLLPLAVAIQHFRFRGLLRSARQMTAEIAALAVAHPIIDERKLMYVGTCLLGLFVALPLAEVTHVEPHFYCLLAMIGSCLTTSRHDIRHLLEAVEWDTLLFFACLFIIVEGLVELGLIRELGNILSTTIVNVPIDNRLTTACILFLWVSSVGSAFLESLPYTATIAAVLNNMQYADIPIGIPIRPLAWALSVGACVGGIGSIMGSSANLVAIAVSHRYSPDEAIEGKHFLQYGLPLLVVLTSISMLWQYVMFSVMGLPGTILS